MKKRRQFRRWLSLFCLLALLAAPAVPAAAAEQPDRWAQAEVAQAVELGLVPADLQNGYGKDITRAEFCRLAVLCLEEAARVNGWDLTPSRDVRFDDTSDPSVLTAAGLGIVSGNGKGSFLPDNGITRQETAVMLHNTLKAMGAPIGPAGASFSDQGSIAAWASGPVSAMVGWGVMNGTGGGAFSPLGSYTRQQAYVTMYRLRSSVYMRMESYAYRLQPGERLETGCCYATGSPSAAWSSSDPAVVAIEKDTGSGAVTLRAVAPGAASVTCRSGDFQMTAAVTVAQATAAAGSDFTGASRLHYSNDVAWDLCRALEQQIGIQIFYLPEFDDTVPGAVVTHATFGSVTLGGAYFQQVYQELLKMKEAFDLYPDGFLKEVVAKKGSRRTQIVLFPSDMVLFDGQVSGMGGGFHGEHVYDGSGARCDRIYYTGTGDPYVYSHEMGHMVVSSAMIANGWTASCNQWVSFTANSGSEGFVSGYAMVSRPEDFAETWAYLWHNRDQVEAMLSTGRSEALRAKIAYLTEVLIKQYKTATRETLPWSGMAG